MRSAKNPSIAIPKDQNIRPRYRAMRARSIVSSDIMNCLAKWLGVDVDGGDYGVSWN